MIIIIFLNIFEFPRIDLFAGVILGYIEYRFFDGIMIRLSYVWIVKFLKKKLSQPYKDSKHLG